MAPSVQQVRGLVLDGYRVSFVLSEAAERIYASVLKDQMAGFPHVTWLEPGRWLPALNEARAVVVPLLSANTLSKISLLIADTLAGNVILHALFMGKKVIAARNGADPAGSGRDKIGFNRGSAPLQWALLERYGVVEDYGCHMTDVAELRSRVNLLLSQVEKLPAKQENLPAGSVRSIVSCSEKVVTAADIRHAHNQGVDLGLSHAALVTPLARDLASRYGVALVEQQDL